MTVPMTVTIEIKVRNPAAYTLNTVVASPRTCTPTDIKIASANIEVVSSTDKPQPLMLEFVDFIVRDFFTLAHRSGLYNRQKPLWECIARLTRVNFHQVTQGIFKKVELPVFDLIFEDSLSAPQIYACILKADASWKEEKKVLESIRDFLKRVEQQQKKQNTLRGVFYCAPSPFPETVLKKVHEMTGSQDPISRYESLLPQPIMLPINLVEYRSGGRTDTEQEISQEMEVEDSSGGTGDVVDRIEDGALIISSELELPPQPQQFSFKLAHPNLSRKK